MDFNLRKIITNLWEIIPILDEYKDNHDANAGRLFDKITSSFTTKHIPLNSIAAFASDGCSTMMGARNSVAQRFRDNNPNIIIIKCPSNVEPERVWSKLKLEKTSIRNKLHLDTVNALLLTSQCIKQSGDCRNFEPSHVMIDLLNNVNNIVEEP